LETASQSVIHSRERRRARRHPVNTPAYASFNGSAQTAPLELCEVLNINESGTCIQAPGPIKVNRLVPLVLEFSETNARIHTAAHVVWSEAGGRAGIRFPELPQVSLEELQRWLGVNSRARTHLENQSTESDTRSSPQVVCAKAGVAAGYTSLMAEWAEIERDVEQFGDNLDAAFQLIAERALTLTWATGAAIALQSRGSSELICEARAGNDSPELGTRLTRSGLSGECILTGNSLRCDDTETDERVDRENCRVLGIRSLIACPIRLHNLQIVGVIEVFSREPAAFWDNDIRSLERLALIVTHAIARANRGDGRFARPEEPSPIAVQKQPSPAPAETNIASLATLSPQTRSMVLFLTGIVAVVSAVWITAPWISDVMNKFTAPKPRIVETKPTEVDYLAMNVAQLKKLAVYGNSAAQYSLALKYAAGTDVPQDYSEALGWFLKAADAGYFRAASKIASCFWAGRGAAQDYGKAYFWGLLAEATGDEAGRVIVINSAPHLSDHQRMAEQQEADDWLRAHGMGVASRASR
jgi:putative methionine-R-sulfoxide reductase with GAF domain